MSEFILMLTRNDETVPDAAELLEQALTTKTQHIGFKDIGLPEAEMRQLVTRIKQAGRTAHLEVVSLTPEAELESARVAIDMGVDYLIGGTQWQKVSEMLRGLPIKYFPYPGEIVDHPARLRGSVEQIVADAHTMQSRIDGINLLAYRHDDLDGTEVLSQVQNAVDQPVICAGSIASLDRVRAVAATGAWAFTIGQAVLDGKVIDDPALPAQLNAVLEAAGHSVTQ